MITSITWLGVGLGIVVAGILAALFWIKSRRTLRQGKAKSGLIIAGVGADLESKPPEPLPPSSPPQKNGPYEPRKNRKSVPDSEEEPVSPKSSPKSLADILQAPTGLQGTLAQVPVHDFLQFLAQGKRSGVLHVVSGRRLGYVKFSGGRIAHCSFRGCFGLVALQAMLKLNEGDFEFFEGPEAHLPVQAEGGEPHSPMDVVETLLQFDARNRAGVKLSSEEGEN